MMDHSEKLKQTLDELHSELSSNQKVDAATREQLQEALGDIQKALDAAERSSAEERQSADSDDGLVERLRAAAAKFEATHPTLAGLLERLTDLLAAAGI